MFAKKSISHLFSILFVFVFILSVTPLQAARAAGTRYAKPVVSGTGTCLSWDNACTLQTALTGAASGGGLYQTPPAPIQAASALELYGTFEAMGVIVNLGAGDDPDSDATAQVEYRVSGSGAYQPGFPLSRVSGTRFVGSLFWLIPGTAYDVRVSFTDPDSGPLNGTSVTGSAATRTEIIIPAASYSYYVTPSGGGTTCSLASPCALSYAISQAQAGNAVVLRGGVYYQGEFTLPRSGTAGTPIVLRSYPGETAVLDGGDPATFAWVAQGGGVYQTTVNAANPHLVTANGQRLYPYQSLADLQSLSWGIPGFFASGTSVYVHLAGNANPTSMAMLVSRYNHAFYVGQDYIYFNGLTFRHYGRDEYAKALYFNDASNNLVQGCTFTINDLGIGLKNAAGRNVIEGNTFSDTNFDWPWDAVKTGSNLETGGVRFYAPVTGRGNIIRHNTFHDYFDGFGACPEETAGETNETDVYDNLVYNAGDDGMETDGECSNVRIWGNTFHDVLGGISLAPVYTGPVYAIRNLIYRTGAGNNDYPGLAFKFNSGYDASGPMFLFHNTADAALPGGSGLDIKEPGEWALITTRNNIWSGTNFALYNANPTQPLDLDYDDLYTTQAGELAWWDGLSDRHLNTLAELRTATGQELHGFNFAPGFAASATGDYTLSETSLLINQGVFLPGINAGYSGTAPDIGAYESMQRYTIADFNGDGKTDVSIFRPSNGIWYVKDQFAQQYGGASDIPVPGDYDGNGTTDVAVFRPSNGVWYLSGGTSVQYGGAGDIPVPGDYDGNGTTDVAVFRPSNGVWYIRGGTPIQYGGAGDIPVPGDYNGDGTTDKAIFRPSNGIWYILGGTSVQYGGAGDIPVPGDYDGNGTTDKAVFRPSNGIWYILGGTSVQYGGAGDIPTPGDYDGNGTTDIAVFRPSNGIWYVNGQFSVQYGGVGDFPLPARDTNGDGDPYQSQE